jgi:hypothetical protein
MQCDRIDKVIYSLKTQHINITNLATCLGWLSPFQGK